MVNGFGRSLLVISAAALVSVSTLRAQGDAKELFEEGVRLLSVNKDAEALQKFKAAVAADPSREDAYRIWKETDSRIWAAMMVKNDNLSKVATRFLRLAQVERKRRSSDSDLIKGLVEKALSDDYETRSAADVKLMSDHGDYAVPYLLDALGNVDEDDQQTYAILALDQIGRDATLPLVAALASENAVLRRNIAAALLYIGDRRALPALKRLAEKDEDGAVRDVANRAIAKIAGNNVLPASLDLFLRQSNGFLRGDVSLLQDGDILDGVWSFRDGKLVHRKVPAVIYPLELAKDAAYSALDVDPSSEAALVALTRAYVAEKAVVDAASPDEEALVALKPSIAELGRTVAVAGASAVRKAFQQNVADKMIPAAVESLRTLAKLEDPTNLQGSPLLDSLQNPDKRIRYGAAVALAGMDAKLSDAQRGQVVADLGQAVLEQSHRVVKVIDPNDSNRTQAETANSETTGLIVDASGSTASGLGDIAKFPPDVLVVNEQLDTFLVNDVLDFIADRPHLKNVKVVLVTKNKAAAQEAYGDKIAGYIEGAVTGAGLATAIDEVLKGADLGADRKAADRVASDAAAALAKLDPTAYPVAAASASLIQAAKRGEGVAVQSLEALGHAAGVDQLAGIVEVMAAAKDSPKIAGAAAHALGRIMARLGKVDQASVDALIQVASDSAADEGLRAAALSALGQAPILPGTRAKLLRDLRVNLGGDAGEK